MTASRSAVESEPVFGICEPKKQLPLPWSFQTS
jgi:hypothetical protein